MEPVEAKAASTPVTPKRMKRTFSSASGLVNLSGATSCHCMSASASASPSMGNCAGAQLSTMRSWPKVSGLGPLRAASSSAAQSVRRLMSASRTSIAEARIS